MFTVVECIVNQHDRMLVAISAIVCVIGSLAFFLLLRRSRECDARSRKLWSPMAALVAGSAVWATHFVAMLAYDGAMPISFRADTTLLSVFVAIVMFWAALRLHQMGDTTRHALAAGAVAAVGIGLMHFTGMAAIIAAARVQYDFAAVAAAGMMTLIAFTLAFYAFTCARGARQIAIPAACAVIGVCALHFGAMASTTLVPDPTLPGPEMGFNRSWLIAAVVVAATSLLFIAIMAAVVGRYLTDLRGLAQATLEGLVIVHSGRIIEVNDRFLNLLQLDAADVMGEPVDRWVLAADCLPVSTLRSAPIEAALLLPGREDCVLEIAVHTIEYRGRLCEVLAVRDLTEKNAAHRQIEHMARHDALTDLPNRVLFDERLSQGLSRARRSSEALAVLALDLDRFKAANDIFGHAEGDRILKRVAAILQSSVRATDTVARVGGDEFMIVQTGVAQPAGARALADRIMAEFDREMNISRDPTSVGVSIGVAVYPDDAADAGALKHGADVALYRAKENGRGSTAFFDRGMDVAVRERRSLENDLRQAIRRNQLSLAFQPLVSTRGATIAGYEALLRWTHPDKGNVEPTTFIPVAEDTGAIIQIGEWVLRHACRAAASWPNDLTVAVNISPVQFQVGCLAEVVQRILIEERCPAERLELEITETALMKNRENALIILRRLRALGVRIVMDDFGTGYSSLSNLQCFPFDKIKIDRSFIANLEDDEAARSIIRAIVGLGRSLELPVVAEGVETEAQHLMVLAEGCSQAQGFLFGYPGPLPRAFPVASAEDQRFVNAL